MTAWDDAAPAGETPVVLTVGTATMRLGSLSVRVGAPTGEPSTGAGPKVMWSGRGLAAILRRAADQFDEVSGQLDGS